MKAIFFKSSTLSLLLPLLLVGQVKRSPMVTAAELQAHVKFLASDQLQGRLAGTAGADEAAKYIASEFTSYGLAPKGDHNSYLQKFEFVAGVRLGSNNVFTFSSNGTNHTLHVDESFRPLGFTSNGQFEGEVVFAGYGISAPDKNYDDYKGIDVTNKAVIVLRYAPSADSSKNEFEQYSSLRYKASKAKELGAKAILVVTGPLDSDKDELIKLSYDQSVGNAGIVAVSLSRKAADEFLKLEATSVGGLQDSIVKSKQPRSSLINGLRIKVRSDVEEIRKTSSNVIGYLEGNDPLLKDELVVIGAHYDHLGFGGEGSGSLSPDTIAIHHGADDNASGTSGLLELAQAFAARKAELKRSLLFVSFTGEEEGLLGSGYYVKNPTMPLERTVAMINLDMIGRLNNRKLIVYGTGTSREFDSLVTRHNSDSAFALSLVKDGFGPSDQSSFYGKQIPVFFFFTDIHSDYHRPSDTWDKINYAGMEHVVRFVESVALDVDQEPTKPKYIAVEMPKTSGKAGRSYSVYVGTVPDFGEQVEGYKISGVREGSPAAKAGLQAGDIIVKFGKVDVKNLYDYTFAIGEYRPGDEVDVVVKRGKETINTKVKLEKKN
ncbi:MAG TPA: M28 family peptidase [Bacteroidota bacterium]